MRLELSQISVLGTVDETDIVEERRVLWTLFDLLYLVDSAIDGPKRPQRCGVARRLEFKLNVFPALVSVGGGFLIDNRST